MSTPRLFLPAPVQAGTSIEITGAELRHLRVLRLGPGAELTVFDGSGHEAVVRLDALERLRATARVLSTGPGRRESALELVLAPAVLKGARMDHVFEKATELGVTRFAPVLTERVQGRRDAHQRWARIVVAAAKQSGRSHVPVVDPPRPLTQVLTAHPGWLVVMAWEDEPTTRLGDLPDSAGRVLAVTGPEGGLTATEVADARRLGVRTVGLGRRLLRAETAAIALAVLAQHRWGDS